MALSTASSQSRPSLVPTSWLGSWIARSFANRIAASLLALSASSVALLGVLSYHFSRSLIEQQITTTVQHASELNGSKLETLLAQYATEHATLARNSLTANALVDTQGRTAYLVPFLREHWLSSHLGFAVALCDFAGQQIASSDQQRGDICRRFPHAARVMKSMQSAAALRDREAVQVMLASPVIYAATGAVEGMLVSEGPLAELVRQSQFVYPAHYLAEIGDANGQTLVSVDKALGSDAELVQTRQIKSNSPLDTLGLTLHLSANRQTLLAPLRWLTITYITLALLLALAVVLVSRKLAQHVVRPLAAVAAAATRASTDLQWQSDIAVSGRDEVAQLAATFNQMLASLRSSYAELEQRVEARTRNLAETQQRLTNVLHDVDDLIWSMSADGKKLLYINPAIEKLTGVSVASFLSDAGFGKRLTHPEDREAFRAAFLLALESNTSAADIRIARADGSTGWLRCRLRAVLDDAGIVSRVDGIATDITDQKRIQEVVDENARRLKTIFGLSPDGFVSFDSNGRLVSVNPAFVRMSGLKERELIGLDIDAFDAALEKQADPARPYPQTARCVTAGVAGDSSAPAHPRHERELVYLCQPAQRVLQRSQRVGSAGWPEQVLYFRDISHENEVDRMKSEFLSTAAHELRTPLASILGFSELLLSRNYDDSTRRELTQTINNQSKLLVHLINELLDLSRIESTAGRDFKLRLQPLLPVVNATLKELNVPNDARKPDCELPEELPLVAIDDIKIRQALLNVVSNAYKYSPQGGQIVIRAVTRRHADIRQVGIAVTDQGIGMKPEHAARAFEKFFRADQSGSIPGTGLGLALVKEIMEIHHGGVELKSKFGIGTTVTLWLPVNDTVSSERLYTEKLGNPKHTAAEING